jgi:hypothetical protein
LIVGNYISVKPVAGDNWVYLQGEINRAIRNGIKNIYVKPGRYPVSKPLTLEKWNGSDRAFFSLNLISSFAGHFSNMQTEPVIEATFSEGPLLNFQLARSCKVLGIVFKGTGKKDFSNQFTPYAGISVDYYKNQGSSGSSGILIQECRIRGFEVGYVESPNGVSLNAENCHVENCSIEHCHISYASTHRQSRQNTVRNLISWENVDIVFDGKTYGQQLGLMPFIDGANIAGGVKQVINYPHQQYSTSARGISAEIIHRIGDIEAGAGSVTFYDCSFDFDKNVFPDSHFKGNGVKFEGCSMRYYDDMYDKAFVVDGVNNTFENCYTDFITLDKPKELEEKNRVNYYHNNRDGWGVIAKDRVMSSDEFWNLEWLDVLHINVEDKMATGRDIGKCQAGDFLTRGHPFFPFCRVMSNEGDHLKVDYINNNVTSDNYHIYLQRKK